jgi:hypothetical protein
MQPGQPFEYLFLLLDEESTGWSPFSSEREYRFAEWVVMNRITKTPFDTLLKLDADQPVTSSHLLLKRIDIMTYDLGMQIWKTGTVSFKRSNPAGLPVYTGLFYHDPIDYIKFLLRQLAYKDQLTYGLKKEYNEMGERIYSEIHTGDWWWN